MKGLIHLWTELATDVAAQCHTSVTLDVRTFERRVENEGDSFFTITLPSFAKEFERALEQEKVDSSSFPGWRRKKGSPLPSFLVGLTSQVFDASSGGLLATPNVDAVAGIRQLALAFGKIERSCSDGRVNAAFAGYVVTDRTVRDWMELQVDEDGPKGYVHPFPNVLSWDLVPGERCQMSTCGFSLLRAPFELMVTPHWHLRRTRSLILPDAESPQTSWSGSPV